MTKTRTTLPLVLSTAVGLTAATLMFALPGDAAPSPSTFSADARGEVWRINRLDLDMSGNPADVDLTIAAVLGLTGQAASPDRAKGVARNLDASPAPAGQASAQSVASATKDTVGATTAQGQAGTLTGVVTHGSSVLTARGRWGGDTTCLDATAPLTQSKSTNQGAQIVPAAIPPGSPGLPIPLPTVIPTEVPTELPSDFPTGLPTDLPLPTLTTGLPTLPTELPTTILPTLPTTLPTTILPTLPITLLPAATEDVARAEGDVSMVEVAPASVEQKTLLETISGTETKRRVYAEALGAVATPSAPAVEFFGGEATLKLTSAPKLAAYSTGGTNGSQVTWTPPTMVLTVDGVDYEVPSDGTALALPYSENEDVVLTLSAGKLTSAEAANGTLAQAVVSALNILIKNGDEVALDAELFPMSVKALSPIGGVDCTPVAVPKNPAVKLQGRNNGPKPDKLKVNAITSAAGAKALLFKRVKGDLKRLKGAPLNGKGDHVFKIRDKNGKKVTTYVAKVGKTKLTLAGKATKKIR